VATRLTSPLTTHAESVAGATNQDHRGDLAWSRGSAYRWGEAASL